MAEICPINFSTEVVVDFPRAFDIGNARWSLISLVAAGHKSNWQGGQILYWRTMGTSLLFLKLGYSQRILPMATILTSHPVNNLHEPVNIVP
jgi:hypothetical protein